MNKEKLGLSSAFPIKETKDTESIELGMSKRFYAACAAMQGILSTEYSKNILNDKIIKMSYMLSDELLKQENE